MIEVAADGTLMDAENHYDGLWIMVASDCGLLLQDCLIYNMSTQILNYY